jgi:hypothetical protein
MLDCTKRSFNNTAANERVHYAYNLQPERASDMAGIKRLIQTYPILFGVVITMICFPLAIIIATASPDVERFFGKNQVWFPFVIFTSTMFPVLVSRFRPRREQAPYWQIATALFLLHVVFFVLFIRYIRALAPMDYILYGPLEWFAVGLVLYYAGRIRTSRTRA